MQPYIQTTKYTCAAASTAMIINHFKPDFNLNVDNEFDIWQKSATLPTKGSSLYALAVYAKEHGLNPTIVVGEREYKFPNYKFKSYKKKEIEIASFSSQRHFNQAKELDIPIEERTFTMEEVKKHLKKGNVLLLRLVIGIIRDSPDNKRNPHYLPVYGIKENKFLVMDPKRGPLEVDEAQFKDAFDKITEIKRDNRMIIFS